MPTLSIRKPLTIILTLKGLSTSPIGCYGCSWNQTPEMDRLAAGGLVWDRWTSPTDQPHGLISKWLSDVALSNAFANASKSACLVTDDQRFEPPAAWSNAGSFKRITPNRLEIPADTIEQTTLAQTFAALLHEIRPSTRLAWLHSSALADIWDAPLLVSTDDERQEPVEQELFGEEVEAEEFRLPARTDVPRYQLSTDDDPDQLFAWIQRYGAQVALLDDLLGWLSDSLSERKPTIVLAGESGFSLGQNGWVGHRAGPLRSPEIRLPMMVSSGGPLRVPQLTDAGSFEKIVQALMENQPLSHPQQWSIGQADLAPQIQTHSDRATKAITTPGWYYVREEYDGQPANERLFLKPDDIDDVNDVARLRPAVLDELG